MALIPNRTDRPGRNARVLGRNAVESARRVIRFVAGFGAFVISLDSMMNIAFPAIAAAFATPPEAMRWVIIPYVFSYSIMSFVGGALADRVGHSRVFRVGLAGVTVAFAMGTVAPTFGWLVAARVLQGLTSGLVYGTAPGIMTLTAPPGAQGRALGFLTAAMGVAFTIGPIVAGALVDAFDWPAVFAVRVPVAIAAFGWAWWKLPDVRSTAQSGMVGAGDLIRIQVVFPCLLSFVANAGIFAIWLLVPFYLVSVLGLSAFAGGLMFMLTPLGTTLAAPIAGRVADRLGPQLPMVVGLGLESAALGVLSGATATTPISLVAAALAVAGFGIGVFQVPNMSAVMREFPAGHQGAAGGLAFMARTLGVVAGVASLSAIVAMRRETAGFDAAFATAFIEAAAAVAFDAGLGLATGRGVRSTPTRW